MIYANKLRRGSREGDLNSQYVTIYYERSNTLLPAYLLVSFAHIRVLHGTLCVLDASDLTDLHQQTAPCVPARTMRTMRTEIGMVRSPLKLRTSCVPAAYHCVQLRTKNLVRSWYAVGTHAYQMRTNCVPDFWYAVVRSGPQLVRSWYGG